MSSSETAKPVVSAAVAKNGVQARTNEATSEGWRTYEVYQRERMGQSTPLIKPRQLVSSRFVEDPYPLLEILRENYPCYRDWVGNRFWITQYDDVTSIFVDEANFETRSKRWFNDRVGLGRDLGGELPLLEVEARVLTNNAGPLAEEIVGQLLTQGSGDLALDLAARIPLELLTAMLDLPAADGPMFARRWWAMQRGHHSDPVLSQLANEAIDELVAYFEPLLEQRRSQPGDDLISAMAALELPDGPATAGDVVATLLEMDHETLHGGLSNLWFLLLGNPEQLELARSESRLMKLAWLETLRHSPPVLSARRFARQEVERFGRLIPEGGLLYLSAGAANRDPRQFADPEQFIVDRKDLCQREPRGHYRADGLPTGISFGTGAPSKHPAVPEGRPQSLYALLRDAATTVSWTVAQMAPNLAIATGAEPSLRSLRLGEMRTCWSLPVTV